MNGNEWEPEHFDEWGNRYEVDEYGHKRKPMQSDKMETHSGFTSCSEPGYCGLCGRMDCRGECFK